MITRISALFLLMLLTGATSAASFDCSKASTFAEKEICRDGYLSSLDEILSDQYKRSYAQVIDKQALLQSQREWLIFRDQCNTQQCLNKTISDRIHALKMYPIEERDQAAQQALQQAQAEFAAQQEQLHLQEQARITAEQQILAQERAAQHSKPQEQRYHAPTESPYNPGVYTPTTQSRGDSWLSRFFDGPAWKWTLLAMIIITLSAMYQHHNESATVYIDYTDAAITNGLPLLGLTLYMLSSWLELPNFVATLILYSCIIAALAFGLYTAFLANGFGVQFILVVIAKVTLVSAFYVLIALLLFSLMPTKFKDETRAQAAARNRRAARDAKIQIAVLSVGYTFLTRWLCRYGEFLPVSETLSYTPSEA